MAAINILRAFKEKPQPFDMVLPGMLAGSVGFILAPGGVGKSMLALEMGISIASGTKDGDLIGFSPKQGKVAYFAAEDPPIAIEHRLHAMGQRFTDQTQDAIAENMAIRSLVGMMPDIMDPKWYDAMTEQLVGFRLIIIDTLTRFHTMDENSNSDMSQLISRLEYIAKKTGASILVPHHTNKGMAMAGRGDEQQAARGASALIDNARWASNLTGMGPDEAKRYTTAPGGPAIKEEDRKYYVRFGISKQNHGAPYPDKWLTRAEGGVLVPTTIYPIEKRKGGDNRAAI